MAAEPQVFSHVYLNARETEEDLLLVGRAE